MDYTDNGEYDKGYIDGYRDVSIKEPVRNLDFCSPSYSLGYFKGREAAHTELDSRKCEE